MRCERQQADHPQGPSPRKPPPSEFGLVLLLLALLATLGLWTLVQAPPGIQHLLLFGLLRLAVLLCVGAVSYRRRRALHGASPVRASSPGSPRSTLAQAALYLQLAWLASELLLGSALLLFHPQILGPLAVEGGHPAATTTATLLTLLPLLCAVAMSGCFLFLQRFAARRRRQVPPHTLECGLAGGFGTLHGPACCSSACGAVCAHHSSVDVICSPISEAGSFSSCGSSASSSAAFYSRSSSSSLGLSGSGGMPSPTGHVRSSGATARHDAVIQAACQILLVEHQLDTNEFCLFVHKRLRPIKTRAEDPSKPSLLRELVSNSFSFQHEEQPASHVADVTVSGGASVTFASAASASAT